MILNIFDNFKPKAFIFCCFMGVMSLSFNAKADELNSSVEQYEVNTSYVVQVQKDTDVIATLGPNKSKVATLTTNINYDVLSVEGNWAKVDASGVEGYVQISNGAMLIEKNEALAKTAESMKRQQLVSYALSFRGRPYVWGGVNPNTGVDCSGFTRYLYASLGIDLPHSSAAQSYSGKPVSREQLMPGDLIFYGGSSINHVAMYIGNGNVCHAASERTGITVSNMDYRKPIRYVSIFR